MEELPHEGFAARDLAVRFRPRPADRLPPALRHALLYPLEDSGGVLLDPAVHLRGGLVEDEVLVAIHEREHARERPPGFTPRLREGPEPREVDVRVPREGEPADRRVLLLQTREPPRDDATRLPHGPERAVGQGLEGPRRLGEAPQLPPHAVHVQSLVGSGAREAEVTAAQRVLVATEVAGEDIFRSRGPILSERRKGGIEGVEEVRDGVVVVELVAGFEDDGEVTLQGTHLPLGDDEDGVREAGLRDVGTEEALRDDLGLYRQGLTAARLLGHVIGPVERVEAPADAVR